MWELGTPGDVCQSTFSPCTPANPWCKIGLNLENEETSSKKLKFEVEIKDKHAETQVVNWSFDEEEYGEKQQEGDGYMLARDRTRREIKSPKRYGYVDLIRFALVAASEVLKEEPKSFKVAFGLNYT